tara:strand:+ start:971 stop:2035 length:1065 start_codon:yes stop_codon:yes gene_type:complete
MTLAGLNNNSTKSTSHLEVHELLDRFELLYDNLDELKDLRRAVIDEDLSSIFRLAGKLTQSAEIFDEFRKAVMENNLHAVFRVLDILGKKEFEEFRKAILEKNIHAIFRVLETIESNGKLELLRKAIINKGESFEVLKLFVDSQVLTTLPKTIRSFPRLNVKDAYARGQLHSKKWVVAELEKLSMHLGTIFLCAGWYGTLATMLFESKKIHLDKIRSFDIDPTCWQIAESINKPWVMDEWKFKATTEDIHKINFKEYSYTTLRSNGTERELFDTPKTIINTSCEHIENWNDWWNKIPNGKLCILQSNDYFELPEHINCVKDVDNFKSIAPMTTYLYTGELPLGKYTRYMLIGIK